MVSSLFFLSLSCRLLTRPASSFWLLSYLLSARVDFFPGHSGAANQAIEAYREEQRADGAQIVADAPWTLSEQLLSIQARLQPAHRMMCRLQCVGA